MPSTTVRPNPLQAAGSTSTYYWERLKRLTRTQKAKCFAVALEIMLFIAIATSLLSALRVYAGVFWVAPILDVLWLGLYSAIRRDVTGLVSPTSLLVKAPFSLMLFFAFFLPHHIFMTYDPFWWAAYLNATATFLMLCFARWLSWHNFAYTSQNHNVPHEHRLDATEQFERAIIGLRARCPLNRTPWRAYAYLLVGLQSRAAFIAIFVLAPSIVIAYLQPILGNLSIFDYDRPAKQILFLVTSCSSFLPVIVASMMLLIRTPITRGREKKPERCGLLQTAPAVCRALYYWCNTPPSIHRRDEAPWSPESPYGPHMDRWVYLICVVLFVSLLLTPLTVFNPVINQSPLEQHYQNFAINGLMNAELGELDPPKLSPWIWLSLFCASMLFAPLVPDTTNRSFKPS